VNHFILAVAARRLHFRRGDFEKCRILSYLAGWALQFRQGIGIVVAVSCSLAYAAGWDSDVVASGCVGAMLQSLRSNPSSVCEHADTFSRWDKDFTYRCEPLGAAMVSLIRL